MTAKSSGKAPVHALISDATLRQIYESMRRLRRAFRGEHATARGLEAVLAATTLQLRAGDMVFSPPGLVSQLPDGVPVYASDAGILLAAGAALGRRDASVVMVFCRAERRDRDAWQAALPLAAKHRLPLLFVLLPAGVGSAAAREAASIASKATDAGVIAIPVDCADAVALYRVAFESLARARRATGPTLIVATPYALEHGPRRGAEMDDPLARMKAYLQSKGLLKTPKAGKS